MYLRVAKRVYLRSFLTRNKCSYVWWPIEALILQCGHICFTVLNLIVLDRYFFFFLQIESCGTLCQTCLLASFFSNICVESLCYILEIITIFQSFSLVSHLLWWSVMLLLCWELFWGTMNHTHIRFNQWMVCVFYLLHQPAVPPSLSLPLGLSTPSEASELKLHQLTDLQWPLNIHVKGIAACVSL